MNRLIFVCYARKDVEFARHLHKQLEGNGLKVWRDETNIGPIEEWTEAVAKGLKDASALIVVISKASMESTQVRREWLYFIEEKKPVICVWLENCDVHFQLRPFQRVDFRDDHNSGQAFLRLHKGLQSVLENNSELKETVEIPFPNISNTDQSRISWDMFREACENKTNKALIERYRTRYVALTFSPRPKVMENLARFFTSSTKCAVITGKAGMGKSSFICHFTHEQIANKAPVWLQDCSTLTKENLDSLGGFIAESIGFQGDLPFILSQLEAQDDSFTSPVVFIFDAVNEFTGDRRALIEAISKLVRSCKSWHVKFILTCRVPAWNTLGMQLDIGGDLLFEPEDQNNTIYIGEFSDSEVPKAYELYRQKSKILQKFSDLSPQVARFIAPPLFMKLVFDAYGEREEIPRYISLRDVFQKYVDVCMHDAHNEVSQSLFRRAIELMYQQRRRELEVKLLREDPSINQNFKEAFESAYAELVDTNLITESEIRKTILFQSIRVLYITYERVFEYLLSELISETNPTITEAKIDELLEIARTTPLVQLRGAAELSLSFSILEGETRIGALVDMARQNRANSRQFLADVIQTIYSEQRETANSIIIQLMREKDTNCKLLAVLVSYQLELDDYLISLVTSGDDAITDLAGLYLYHRWSSFKTKGRLNDGYDILRKIIARIGIFAPRDTPNAVKALVSLIMNILPNVVDAPWSVSPLVEIGRELFERVSPDVRNHAGLTGLARRAVMTVIQQIAIQTIIRFNTDTFLDSDAFYADYAMRRYLVDTNLGVDLKQLSGHETQLYELLHVPNNMIRFTVPAILFVHLNYEPEACLETLQTIFSSTTDCEVQYWLCFSLFSVVMNRLLLNKPLPDAYNNLLEQYFMTLWENRSLITPNNEKAINFFTEDMLTYMLLLEEGRRSQSSNRNELGLVQKLILNPVVNDIRETKSILMAIEKACYHRIDRQQYFVEVLLDPIVRSVWLNDTQDLGIAILGRLRTISQELIDGLLLHDEKRHAELWNKVRSSGAVPVIQDTTLTKGRYLYLPIATQIPILKVYGVILLDFSTASNLNNALQQIFRTIQQGLLDFELLELKVVCWWRANDPDWNNFKRWDIAEDILSRRHEEAKNYLEVYSDFIKKAGKGVFYR